MRFLCPLKSERQSFYYRLHHLQSQSLRQPA
nr:MAG TPA: hypothetical protein [Caudoviricetes sp.]